MVSRSALEAQLAAALTQLAEERAHVRALQELVASREAALWQQEEALEAALLRNRYLEERYTAMVLAAEQRARRRTQRPERNAQEG